MHRQLVPALAALACTTSLAAGIAATTAPANGAGAGADTLSIVVELDLPNAGGAGARVFAVDGVTPGPGPELTTADEVSNPSEWCGTISVDVNPGTTSVAVGPDAGSAEGPCDFETVSVTLTGAGITSANRASGDLLTGGAAGAVTRTSTAVEGGVELTWTTAPDEPLLLDGTETFTYTVATPTPTTAPPTTTTAPPTGTPTTAPPTTAPPTTPPAPTAFTPTKRPILKGRPLVGRTVRVRHVGRSDFAPPARKVRVTWLRGNKRIRGAKGLTYTVVRADRGKRLTARITVRGTAPTTVLLLRTAKVTSPPRG